MQNSEFGIIFALQIHHEISNDFTHKSIYAIAKNWELEKFRIPNSALILTGFTSRSNAITINLQKCRGGFYIRPKNIADTETALRLNKKRNVQNNFAFRIPNSELI